MLLFAHDLTIFRTIKSLDDANPLQSDLNAFVKWCGRNDLFFNVNKCKLMSFNRSRFNIPYIYNINNVHLKRVFNFKGFGVFFHIKLNFDTHVN